MKTIDDMLNLIKGDAITVQDLNRIMATFHVGDIVHIPYELLEDYNKKIWGNGMKAEVIQICKYHIVVKLEVGYRKSIHRTDCYKMSIIKKAKIKHNDEFEIILEQVRKELENE